MKALNHDELGITFAEQLALMGTLQALKSGLIVDLDPAVPNKIRSLGMTATNHSVAKALSHGEHVFHMCFQGAANEECGSVGCVGGYMALAMGLNMIEYVNNQSYDGVTSVARAKVPRHSTALHKLFYPDRLTGHTTQGAIDAIERFLTGNTTDPWDET